MSAKNKKTKFCVIVILILFCILSFFNGCGEIKSEKAVEPLIQAIKDDKSFFHYKTKPYYSRRDIKPAVYALGVTGF